MVRLLDLHFVDWVFDSALIVASGVTLLSGAAWTVSRWLPRKPAARHLVLASALAGCLAVPVLTLAFLVSEWSLISVPLLPIGKPRNIRVVRPTTPTTVGIRPAALSASPSVDAVLPKLDPERAEPVQVATADRESRPKTLATPKLRSTVHDAEHRTERAGRLATYRRVATAAIIDVDLRQRLSCCSASRSAWEVRRLRGSSSPTHRRLAPLFARPGLPQARRPAIPAVVASRVARAVRGRVRPAHHRGARAPGRSGQPRRAAGRVGARGCARPPT